MSTAERRQQDFDKVWQHFVVESGRPGVQNGMCMMRTSEGACCAIGVLVPAAQHRVLGSIALARRLYSAEDYSVYRVGGYNKQVDALPLRSDIDTEIPAFLREDPAFYCRMQGVHDHSVCDAQDSRNHLHLNDFKARITRRLREFAAHYTLNIPGENHGYREGH